MVIKDNHLFPTLIKNKNNIILAHRGLTNTYQENTYNALKDALNTNSIDGLELDVTLTMDKKLVLFHDVTLKRLLNENKNINDINFNEIKDLQISKDIGISNKIYDNYSSVILLEDFLHLLKTNKFGTKKLINVEFKYEPIEQSDIKLLVDNTINILKDFYKNIYFTSFNIKVIEYLIEKYKNKLMIGIIIDKSNHLKLALEQNIEVDIFIVNKNIDPKYFLLLKEKRYYIGVYTINEYYLLNEPDTNKNKNDTIILKNENISIFIKD